MIIKRTLTSLALAGALAFGLSGCPREIEQIVDDFNKDKKSDIVSVSYKDLSFNYKEPRTRGYSGSFDQYVAFGNGDKTFQEPKKSLHYNIKPEY